jgi:hypothetical protein
MPRAPKRRALTGCRRRKPKHQAHPNKRWVHLSSRQAGQMGTLQTVMATTSLFCMFLNQLCALILAAETVVTAQANLAVLDVAFDSVLVTLVAFLGLLQALHVADTVLFDIPFHEEAVPQQYTCSKNLWIADLNNVQALKMTEGSVLFGRLDDTGGAWHRGKVEAFGSHGGW